MINREFLLDYVEKLGSFASIQNAARAIENRGCTVINYDEFIIEVLDFGTLEFEKDAGRTRIKRSRHD